MIRKSYIASFLVLAAIAGGVAINGVTQQGQSRVTTYADVPVGAARLFATPKEKAVKVGDQFSVDLMLSTGSDSTSGVDAVVRYDADLLEIVDADSAATGIQIAPGALFDFTPLNEVIQATGSINFSASQQPTNNAVTTTDGKLATVTFKAKAAGKATLRYTFTPGDLSDSNVIKPTDGRDLLNVVEEATINVSR
jgi:hypothetical protein